MDLSPRQSKKLRPSLDIGSGNAGDESKSDKKQVSVQVDAHDVQQGEAVNHQTTKTTKTSFRALGNVVLAMQRFKASLNPTYTYGKQSSPSPSPSLSRSTAGAEHSAGGEPAQTSKYAYSDRGHRVSLLLAPLPKSDDEENA